MKLLKTYLGKNGSKWFPFQNLVSIFVLGFGLNFNDADINDPFQNSTAYGEVCYTKPDGSINPEDASVDFLQLNGANALVGTETLEVSYFCGVEDAGTPFTPITSKISW